MKRPKPIPIQVNVLVNKEVCNESCHDSIKTTLQAMYDNNIITSRGDNISSTDFVSYKVANVNYQYKTNGGDSYISVTVDLTY